ncbi:MAG TPA: acyl-CoA dehydrogenase family protein [Myxococcota bacterium]|nr:acyl-CoA dehydrogenase family protein [Myxococcota bacterium]
MTLGSEEILESARALAPAVAKRGDEIAKLRRLPGDLVSELKTAGAFRMPMPAAWGGPEMSPRAQNEVVEILSAADASVGWCVMIGSDAGFFGSFLDEAVAREIYPDLDMVTAGLAHPVGRAVRVPGGYRVSGRWAFGSGCTHADVMLAGCLILDGDQPVLGANGLPESRMLLAPSSGFEVLDTWHTTGLAGSGSHDYTTHDLFVPEEHGFSLRAAQAQGAPLSVLGHVHHQHARRGIGHRPARDRRRARARGVEDADARDDVDAQRAARAHRTGTRRGHAGRGARLHL